MNSLILSSKSFSKTFGEMNTLLPYVEDYADHSINLL